MLDTDPDAGEHCGDSSGALSVKDDLAAGKASQCIYGAPAVAARQMLSVGGCVALGDPEEGEKFPRSFRGCASGASKLTTLREEAA